MKLYEVPRFTKIRVIGDTTAPPDARKAFENEILKFHHIDGMYSYCTDGNGDPVHLPAWQEVRLVK